MAEIKPGSKILEESNQQWIFAGFLSEDTISIAYFCHNYKYFQQSILSYSANYYYRIQKGTQINLPHTDKKTYVVEINAKDNIIYLSSKPVD